MTLHYENDSNTLWFIFAGRNHIGYYKSNGEIYFVGQRIAFSVSSLRCAIKIIKIYGE